MSASALKLDLQVRRGSSVALPIRIETSRYKWAAITAITREAPVEITAPGHGFPNGWRAAVATAGGMTQINIANPLPKDRELRPVDVIDADTVQINSINASAFSAYTSGGYLVGFEPLDMSGIESARMDVRGPSGELLASFSTDDGTLEINAAACAVVLTLTAVQSRDLPFSFGLYDLELIGPGVTVSNVVAPTSTLTVIDEQSTNHD